jgi:hypothetical protein
VLKEKKPSFVQQNTPVFTFDNGQFLTPETVSKAIQKFLEKHIGKMRQSTSRDTHSEQAYQQHLQTAPS